MHFCPLAFPHYIPGIKQYAFNNLQVKVRYRRHTVSILDHVKNSSNSVDVKSMADLWLENEPH